MYRIWAGISLDKELLFFFQKPQNERTLILGFCLPFRGVFLAGLVALDGPHASISHLVENRV